MKKFSIAMVCALLTALSLPSAAHKRWLMPTDFALSDKETVSVDFTASNNIFYPDKGMPLQSVQVVTPAGKAQAIANPVQGKRRSTFDVDISEQGSYRIYAGGTPMYFVSYQLPGEQKPKRARGPLEKLQQELPAQAKNVKFMRLQSLIETFVTLGDAAEIAVPDSLQSALRLEFITHPSELYSDEPGRFRLLLNGKPLADTEVMLIPEGTRYRNQQGEIVLKTGAKGEFTVTWPTPGRYLLASSHQQTLNEGEIAMHRYDYFVTLEVLAP